MADEETDTKLCSNCKRQISASNFVMHEAHCRRHIALCKHCEEPIPKGELDVHFEEVHAKIACPRCSVQVEKNKLEEHEEVHCAKKPQKCDFCELEFPKDEMEAHTDYCGSRTEPCPKCGQYIMLKDQVRHDSSNCTFPEVKPQNNSNHSDLAGYSDPDTEAFLRSCGVFTGVEDSFQLNEMSRMHGLNHFHTELNGAGAHAGFGVRGRNGPRLYNKVSERRTGPTPGKPAKVNRKSDLNRQREVGLQGGDSPDVSYDSLLALHLATDLSQEDDIKQLIQSMEKTPAMLPVSPGSEHDHLPNLNTVSEDMCLIPCEFCGVPVLADDLIQHQSGCMESPDLSLLPQDEALQSRSSGSGAPSRSSGESGDNRTEVLPGGTRRQPRIINNLGSRRNENRARESSPDVFGATDMMLPCEFCDGLYPADVLFTHQVVCDKNYTATPRVMSPAVHNTREKGQMPTNFDAISRNIREMETSMHPPPYADWVHEDSDEENDSSNYFRNRERKISNSSSEGASSHGGVGGNIRNTLKKYGVETEDRGDHYVRSGASSRTGASSSRPNVSHIDKSMTAKGRANAARTRSTLDNLLHDSDEPELTPNHTGAYGGRKGLKNDVNASRQNRTGKSTSNGRVPGAVRDSTRKTTTTARDVQRELDRYSSPTQPRPRASRPLGEDLSGNVESRATPARSRPIRANNVFAYNGNNRSRDKEVPASNSRSSRR